MKAREIKIDLYRNSLYSYGVLPLLILIEENKVDEDYEECQLIFDILKAESKKYNLDLPLEFSKDVIDDIRAEFWRLGLSGNIAISNIPSYVTEIKVRRYHAEQVFLNHILKI